MPRRKRTRAPIDLPLSDFEQAGTGGALALMALAILGGVGIFAMTRKAKASSTKSEPLPNPDDDEFDPDDLIADELFSGIMELSVTWRGSKPTQTVINKISKAMLNDLSTGAFIPNVGCEDAPVLDSLKSVRIVKLDGKVADWRLVYDFFAEFIDEPIDFLPGVGGCALTVLRTPQITSSTIAKNIVGVRVKRTR